MQKLSIENEKRRYIRLNKDFDATIKTQCLGEKTVIVKNISEGGVYIEITFHKLDSPLVSFICLRNEKIYLDINIKDRSTTIKGFGFARWSKEIISLVSSPEKKYGLGIEFTEISSEQKNRISSYISEHGIERKIIEPEEESICEKISKEITGNLERRRTPRIPLNLPLRLDIFNPPKNIPHTIFGESFDLSKRGVGVKLKNIILPPGLFGILNIDLPDSTLKIECKVVWSNIFKPGETRCGMYFVKVENDHISTLDKITTKRTEKKRKFAFITNLRDAGDWPRVVFTSKFLPQNIDPASLKKDPGYIIWTHFNIYDKIEGYIIVILITGKEILQLPPKEVRTKILSASLFAQNELKVNYIGLGSYVPSVTIQGKWLEFQPEINTYLTHGDHLTTYSALEGICKKIGLNIKDTKVAIVGATGLIGQGLSRILAKQTKSLILIGRNWNKLSNLEKIILSENKYLKTELNTTNDITNIKEADLVISVTSSPDAIIKQDYFKKGAIIYDLAQPMDVPPEVCTNRLDVLKVDGGYVTIPDIELGVDMGTPKGTTFACLGDVILNCLEDTKQNFVGPIEPKWVEKIGQIAQKYGFGHAELSCFSWPIPNIYLPLRTKTTEVTPVAQVLNYK